MKKAKIEGMKGTREERTPNFAAESMHMKTVVRFQHLKVPCKRGNLKRNEATKLLEILAASEAQQEQQQEQQPLERERESKNNNLPVTDEDKRFNSGESNPEQKFCWDSQPLEPIHPSMFGQVPV